jgi:hypothetical protein
MTIVIPKPNFIDRILRILGKKRGVAVHAEATDPDGTQTYYAPKKERILTALLRPSGKSLSDEEVDIFALQLEDEVAEEKTRNQIWMPLSISGLIAQEFLALVRNP